ncbi:MAG TPA: hypothetical protein VJO52_08070 [Gemmatimonadaceae bacterium]|nr:hypothetical protein [Gemmatimonadaceae bacterium]
MALGAYYTGSPWIGILCAMAARLIFGLIHGIATIRYHADQVVSGVAINILAIGVTRYFLHFAFGRSSNSPRIAGFTTVMCGEGLIVSMVNNPLIVMRSSPFLQSPGPYIARRSGCACAPLVNTPTPPRPLALASAVCVT